MSTEHRTESAVGSTGRRVLRLAAFCLLLAAIVAVARRVPAVLQGQDLFSDDAYYYLVTARNFVDTGRFTFDGLSETDGFHPLLFWVEAAGYAMLGTGAGPRNEYLAACLAVAAMFLLTIGGCTLAVLAPARTEDDTLAQDSLLITMCVVLLPRFATPFLGGMEAILVLPLLLLVGVLAWRERYGLAGAAALLLVMARLDTFPYLVLPIAAGCAWRGRERGQVHVFGRRFSRRTSLPAEKWTSPQPTRERANVRAALRAGCLVALPATLGTLLLMAWNRWHFGNPMPIHGVLKSCLPRIHFQWQHVFSGDSDSTTLTFALLAALVGVGLLLAGRQAGRSLRGLGLGAAMLALIQIAAFALFQKWSKPIPVWYFGPAVVTGTFALAAGVATVLGPRRLRTLAVVAGLAVLTVNVAAAARAWYREFAPGSIDARAATEDTAARIVEFMKTTPGDRIWACTDCGKLAFWSGRRVVNLDGLINDFAYQKALRDRRLAQYLADKGVRYLVFLVWDRPQCERGVYEPMYECRVAPDLFSGAYRSAGFYVYSYQYLNYSDVVRLPREAEVWRSPATRDGQAQGKAVVFDLQIALHGSGALPR